MLDRPIVDVLVATLLATGALGTAAFGIVEGLKRWRLVGEAGFAAIPRILGPMMETLAVAYGARVEETLRAQYRGDRGELARVLRQGTRIGLTADNAARVAADLRAVSPAALEAAARALEAGQELEPELRNAVGRFELAADARIEGALALAQVRYAATARIAAAVTAVIIALAVGLYTGQVYRALLIGLAAVPLAPIAKDLATAVRSAARALGARS